MKKVTIFCVLVAFALSSFAQMKQLPFSDLEAAYRIENQNLENIYKIDDFKKKDSKTYVEIFAEDFSEWIDTVTVDSSWQIINGPESTGDEHWHHHDSLGTAVVSWVETEINNQAEKLITPEIIIPDTGSQYRLTFDFYTEPGFFLFPFNEGDFAVLLHSKNGTLLNDTIWQEDDSLFLANSFINESWERKWNTVRINLGDAGISNNDTVQFSFYYEGKDAASFHLDNVTVHEVQKNDLILREKLANYAYMNGGYVSKVHINQAYNYNFDVRSSNVGTQDQTAAKLNIKVKKDGNQIFGHTGITKAISSFATDTITLTDTTFYLDYYISNMQDTGKYDVFYEVLATDKDTFPGDNIDSLSFRVDQYQYSRFIWEEASYSFTAPNDGDFFGTSFFFVRDDTIKGIEVYLTENSSAGAIIKGRLYKREDWGQAEILETEDYVITEEDLGKWIALSFIDYTGDDLYIQGADAQGAPSFYIAGIEIFNGAYKASIAIDDSPIHSFTTESWFRFENSWGWFPGSPSLRLTNNPTLNYVGVNKLVAQNDNIKVYPNPTAGTLNITNVENAQVLVYNIVGEVVASIDNASAFNKIDISSLANGTYLVKVIGDNFVSTKKVSLIK